MKKLIEKIGIREVFFLVGAIIILAGLYYAFFDKNFSSSGIAYNKYSSKTSTGTLSPFGMIFCGIVICIGSYYSIKMNKYPDSPRGRRKNNTINNKNINPNK